MGLFDSVVNNVVSSMSHSAGHAIGNAVGNAIGNMAGEGINSVTTDMKIQNEEKMNTYHEAVEQRQKLQNIPAICPHCSAPTNGKLICEYCQCKVIE